MRSLDQLRREHRAILRALSEVPLALEPFNVEAIRDLLAFFTGFVESVHHSKEEVALFPKLVSRLGELGRGPTEVMKKEHEIGAAYLRATRAALPLATSDAAARDRVVRSLRAYAALTESHLRKENEVLYPLAERDMVATEDADLVGTMTRVAAELIDQRQYDAWLDHFDPVTPVPSDARREPTEQIRVRIKPPHMLDARSLAGDEVPSNEDSAEAAKAGRVLFSRGAHKAILLHDFGRGLQVQANQYLLIDGKEGMILDPGGPKVYPAVYAESMLHLGSGQLKYVFLSHQDPDIGTSINAWLMDTRADAYISRLWVRFLPHFGIDRLLEHRLKAIPDEGMELDLGGSPLLLVPAHFLHSPGNFHVYDPTSKILFSGDLGGSLGGEHSTVRDFDAHIPQMLGFHRRYMASNKAMARWVERVRNLDVDIIAPQHGPLFQGKPMVKRFLDWAEALECGVDLI